MGCPWRRSTQHIQSAQRHRYNTETDRYEIDTRPGSHEKNPHYSPPPAPTAQEQNPMESSSSIPAPIYGYHSVDEQLAVGSALGFVMYSLICASLGASDPSAEASNHPTPAPPKAANCDYSKDALIDLSDLTKPSLPRTIVLHASGQNFCYGPKNANTSSSLGTRTYFFAHDCNGAPSQQAIYDTMQRIAFPKDDFGIPLCLTAPTQIPPSTNLFDTLRVYGTCVNPYGTWRACTGPKHAANELLQSQRPIEEAILPGSGRCVYLENINKKWLWNGYHGRPYKNEASCYRANKCGQGGACYRWNETAN